MKEFHSSKSALEGSLDEIITRICHSVEERFGDLNVSPIYNYLVPILDVNMWSSDDRSLITYGNEAINDLTALWKELLKNNGCATTNIPAQWQPRTQALHCFYRDQRQLIIQGC